MKELGEALKLIFEKIAGFFDIFDLSFFVSGAVGFSALLYWLSSTSLSPPALDGWVKVLAVILACYVSGLLCFAGGRWVRMFLLGRWFSVATAVECVNALRGHGLENEQVFAKYIGRPDEFGSWRLYVRLRAELRQTPESAPTLSFLNRYWVMAATYDGLAFALIVWVIVLVALMIQRSVSYVIGIPLCIVLVIFAVVCSREASRFVIYQVEELVAAIAAATARK
jgi:hypothetical protein